MRHARSHSPNGPDQDADPEPDVGDAPDADPEPDQGDAPDADPEPGRGHAPDAEPDPTASADRPVSPGVFWEGWNIPRGDREERNGHKAAVVWLTGPSAAGKTTIAREVERRLFRRGVRTVLLEGDQLRHGLCGDLAFSAEDREESVRRVGEVAKLFFEHGNVVVCTFVSPFRSGRDQVRALLPEGRFLEVHVHAPLEELRRRDPKGLYEAEELGEVAQLPGSRGRYEEPEHPELRIDTVDVDADRAAEMIIERLKGDGLVG